MCDEVFELQTWKVLCQTALFMGETGLWEGWGPGLSPEALGARLLGSEGLHHPQIPMLKPNPQCDGIGRWSLREVLRS